MADLMVFAGNCAWSRWGSRRSGSPAVARRVGARSRHVLGLETSWLADQRYSGDRDLENPLAAVQMGLIYVNPEGPTATRIPSPPRGTSANVPPHAMNDRGDGGTHRRGHTFARRTARARDPRRPEPEAAPLEAQGSAGRAATAPARGATPSPADSRSLDDDADEVEHQLLLEPLRVRVGADQEPGGAHSGRRSTAWVRARPDAPIRRSATPRHADHDLALRFDPAYEKISRRFYEHPDEFRRRLRPGVVQVDAPRHGADLTVPGPLVPASRRSGRIPCPPSPTRSSVRRTSRPSRARSSLGLSISQLVSTAWRRRRPSVAPTSAAAPTGPHPPRAQKDWDVNTPPSWRRCCRPSRDPAGVQRRAGRREDAGLARRPHRAGGCAAVEHAAKKAGYDVSVPFAPGRTDATQEQTDVEAFAVLEPTADGFRNYLRTPHPPAETSWSSGAPADPQRAGDDRAVGGMRVLARTPGLRSRCLHHAARDAHKRLLREPARHGHEWQPASGAAETFTGRDRRTASQVDRQPHRLVSAPTLAPRARGVYACDDARRSSCATSRPRGAR